MRASNTHSTYARRRPGSEAAELRAASAASPNEVVPRLTVVESRPRRQVVGGLTKRGVDLAITSLLLAFALPLMAVIWIAVRLDSPGPGLFRQQRGGFRGSFEILKFRTMHVHSGEVIQAVSGDARVTRIGRFLRRTSLDELPQLFNVLRGDMSLVGPRPHALLHDIQFSRVHASYPVRYQARPGITGLAQVRGFRGPTDTHDKVRQRTETDLEYVRRWSLLLDLYIIVWTPVVMLWPRNAV
jgi:putative colanic acid biosysnthesis UDP-glucose lipid carrier transferase